MYDDVPLVVDLDGTLVYCDTLHDSLWLMARARPLSLAGLPYALSSGKAPFKQFVAGQSQLDVRTLPYNEWVLRRIREAAGRRRVVLCTGANQRIADDVAAHIGAFDLVIGSDGTSNLTGEAKASRLVQLFGERGFDYVGNSIADMPVFRQARHAVVANPASALLRRISEIGNLSEQEVRGPAALNALLSAMRPHQWLKNILVFAPLLTATGVEQARGLLAALLAFLSFSLVASSVYLANDLMDLEADRRHPRKRGRPLAAGTLSVPIAVLGALGLLVGGFGIGWQLEQRFVAVLGAYVLATGIYMVKLKRVPILDSIVLASLYTLRIIGGAAAIAVIPSFWLLAFSVFFFMSLALGKRYAELVELESAGTAKAIPGREYRPEDLQTLLAQGNATGCAAVVVLALYIHSGLEPGQYRHPELLWALCLVLLYWISKFWLNAQRREVIGDPVIWAATNRVSRGLAVLAVLLVMAARWLPESALSLW
ncbi:MAG: UbiA family prenyltransferase [Gemmatimonadaceae bacterium]|nr:UbiA family prenyltransferase [Gemmatimonadaceae bacterium]